MREDVTGCIIQFPTFHVFRFRSTVTGGTFYDRPIAHTEFTCLHPRPFGRTGERDSCYATLEILRRLGVDMQDPEGREILLEAGAWESTSGQTRLKIPENLVTDALDRPPRASRCTTGWATDHAAGT